MTGFNEYSRECLLIRSERRWTSAKVMEALAECDGTARPTGTSAPE
jgi:hypothetical protein